MEFQERTVEAIIKWQLWRVAAIPYEEAPQNVKRFKAKDPSMRQLVASGKGAPCKASWTHLKHGVKHHGGVCPFPLAFKAICNSTGSAPSRTYSGVEFCPVK